jgi:spoIIIJ-associated protein
MRAVEKTGKTIEEAVQLCLAELNADQSEVEIEVLEEGNKGLFGLIGSRQARVSVRLINDPVREATKLLESILAEMHVKARIEMRRQDENIFVSFSGSDLGVLIGRRGETLDALQYLLNLMMARRQEERVRYILDVEGYRERREQTLTKLARRLSEKVKRTRKSVVLEPMNPQERRVIHTALQNDPMVMTFSEGEEPYRKVVISLKRS